jgi:hypothetical protein
MVRIVTIIIVMFTACEIYDAKRPATLTHAIQMIETDHCVDY